MSSSVNLHIHTVYSDGGNTPAEIVAMLKEVGVTTFSITDHDTVEGNIEAAALAKEHELIHINGIELSCCFADGELGLDESWVIHILGYGFNMDLMRKKLAEIDVKKHRLLRELFDLLVADGYNIELENVARDGRIAERTFISKELIRKGYATDGNECFSKILNTDRYRPFAKYKPSIKDGIEIIQSCEGLAVWAHPFGITRGGKKDLSNDQVSTLLPKMLEYGVDGIEVYYEHYTQKQIAWLKKRAEDHSLFKTLGTDYHNTNAGVPYNRDNLSAYYAKTDDKILAPYIESLQKTEAAQLLDEILDKNGWVLSEIETIKNIYGKKKPHQTNIMRVYHLLMQNASCFEDGYWQGDDAEEKHIKVAAQDGEEYIFHAFRGCKNLVIELDQTRFLSLTRFNNGEKIFLYNYHNR